ncbi:MAG: hypothetical protein ABIT05_01450 [Chitinophagaceae bacterium]
MQQTIAKVPKKEFWIILGITGAVLLLIILLVFMSKNNRQHGDILVKNLELQNGQLEKQNKSLLSTVEKLNIAVEESVRQDSAMISLTVEQLQLLPVIDNKVSTIKKQYEKDAISYRNLDAHDVELYISNEARRLRNE